VLLTFFEVNDLLPLTVLLGLCCYVLYDPRPLKYSTVWQYASSTSVHQAWQHVSLLST
jgi:hypothetical protein